jgi:hypothetical protein
LDTICRTNPATDIVSILSVSLVDQRSKFSSTWKSKGERTTSGKCVRPLLPTLELRQCSRSYVPQGLS